MSKPRVRTYLFSYLYQAQEWSFEVPAYDEHDAKMRVSRMAYAKFDGELTAKVPAYVGWIMRPIVWLRNRLWRYGR